ncbi:hypothetical protein AVEN_51375-1 [Araneus ventricosus]|uniref:Uncharacterized protein n=1 Tax=Araneus ventricosus TaxID=182803 RepID=A0A4Y2TL72_ARAVE|nr:hypothetical protein AVEN_51375-1 [Araneus ventricosus]
MIVFCLLAGACPTLLRTYHLGSFRARRAGHYSSSLNDECSPEIGQIFTTKVHHPRQTWSFCRQDQIIDPGGTAWVERGLNTYRSYKYSSFHRLQRIQGALALNVFHGLRRPAH